MAAHFILPSLSYQKNRPRLGIQIRENNSAHHPNIMLALHSWLSNTQSNNQSEDSPSLAFGDKDPQ